MAPNAKFTLDDVKDVDAVTIIQGQDGSGNIEFKSDGTVIINDPEGDFKSTIRHEVRPPAWSRGAGESWGSFTKRLMTEGHTGWDAFFLAAAATGQVMLTKPNALAKAGVGTGLIVVGLTSLCGFWTMILMISLYWDRKRDLIKRGEWYDDPKSAHRKNATQFHDVMGFYLGKYWQWVVQAMMAISFFGTGVKQVVACAGNQFYGGSTNYDKRTLQLIWGAVLIPFTFVPTFRKFRVIMIIGVVGTTYTAIYAMWESTVHGFAHADETRWWPKNMQNFFNGASVTDMSGHSISYEIMEAMQSPGRYWPTYIGGYIWTLFLCVPHAVLINLSWPNLVQQQSNMYALFPPSAARNASIWLMILHQLQAWVLYVVPLCFIWEKLIGTHHKPLPIRLASRLPVALAIWLFAMAFPFYDTVNAIFGSLTKITSLAVPCLAFNWAYRKPEYREQISFTWARAVFDKLGWTFVLGINWVIIVIALVGDGFAAAFVLKQLVENTTDFGFFAACYQCPKPGSLYVEGY